MPFITMRIIVLIVLDNSTTAMTGHQPHPGTGKNGVGEFTQKISISKMLEAAGVPFVRRVNPLDLRTAIQTSAGGRGISRRFRSNFRVPLRGVGKTGCRTYGRLQNLHRLWQVRSGIGLPRRM